MGLISSDVVVIKTIELDSITSHSKYPHIHHFLVVLSS